MPPSPVGISVRSLPSTLVVTSAQEPAEEASIEVCVSLLGNTPLQLTSVTVSFGVGDETNDLVAISSGITLRVPEGWSGTSPDAATFIALPDDDLAAKLDAATAYNFQLTNLVVATAQGVAPLDVSVAWGDGESMQQTCLLTKAPRTFFLDDLLVTPPLIDAGASITLSWHGSELASYQLIVGDQAARSVPHMDTFVDRPQRTTVYTIIATMIGPSDSPVVFQKQAVVTVRESTIASFTAPTDLVEPGASIALSWRTSDAQYCRLDALGANGIPIPIAANAPPQSDGYLVSAAANVERYELTAFREGNLPSPVATIYSPVRALSIVPLPSVIGSIISPVFRRRLAYSSGNDGVWVRMLLQETGRCVYSAPANRSGDNLQIVSQLLWHPQTGELIVSDHASTLTFIDVDRLTSRRVVSTSQARWSISADGRWLLGWDQSAQSVELLDGAGGALGRRQVPGLGAVSCVVGPVRAASGEVLVYLGLQDRAIELRGESLTVRERADLAGIVAISPDASVAICSANDTLRFLRAEDGQELRRFANSKRGTTGFSCDGKVVAQGGLKGLGFFRLNGEPFNLQPPSPVWDASFALDDRGLVLVTGGALNATPEVYLVRLGPAFGRNLAAP